MSSSSLHVDPFPMPGPLDPPPPTDLLALAERIREELCRKLLSPCSLPRECWFKGGRLTLPAHALRRRAGLWARIRTTEIKINSRLTRSLGRAFVKTNRLEIASVLALPENQKLAEDTIRHEFAHILAPAYTQHGAYWKTWALFCGTDPVAACREYVHRDPKTHSIKLTCEVCGLFAMVTEKWLKRRAWVKVLPEASDPDRGLLLLHLACRRCSSRHIRLTRPTP